MTDTSTLADIVNEALGRLKWLATDRHPDRAYAYSDPDLPAGWVRISDDHADLCIDDACSILDDLDSVRQAKEDLDYTEYYHARNAVYPKRFLEWPERCVHCEQVGSGSPQDNPLCVITLATNRGIQFVAGPHGTDEDALHRWMDYRLPFAQSRAEAVEMYREQTKET